MIAADTNLLVRILVDDPNQSEQVAIARKIASDAKQMFVPQIVAVELVWVLQAAYKLDKSIIVPLLEHLLHNSAFILQAEERFMEALELFKKNSCGFSDCLIAAESQAANCTLMTFDKKLSRLYGVKLAGKKE
ncbi:type II toxin-antitoxin system VapC family toxin [Mariprofundus erugo]|uniref:Type II toxin-antitoxin system VapC family toxin n=1 Tax=Mariprofundus erugo TaxID=2528639 RepID=A0A5R9GNS3_9PROT|nr:type II toxin-antitoxin system VapC family toxin [Mariprofundus erugo]TLS66725.1 type II toxin-antitoxin system VapC family toxin [Mariprofundus erugo]